jgi:DNA-binding transcriptional MerR regulator
MRIGELAARAGVNVQTILFYERRRLLPRPPRTSSGYRSYTDADLAQVLFIRQTQHLGFTLREIAALLPIHGSPQDPGRRSRRTAADEVALFRIVSERLEQIDGQIATLQQIRDALRNAIDQARSRLAFCPASGQTATPPRRPNALNRPRRKRSA